MALINTFLSSKSLTPLFKYSKQNIQLSGLNESSVAIAAAAIFSTEKRDMLLVADKLDTAEKLRDDLEILVKDQLAFFPNDELLPFDTREANPAIISLRIETLFQLSQSKLSIVVCESRALARKLVSPDAFKNQVLHLAQSKEIDFDQVIEILDKHGFTREDTVEKVGTFSVRGGIIDVYPWTQDDPIRIEFYGDEIESMRTFDLVSQRSIKQIDSVDIYSNIFDQDGESSLLAYLNDPIILQYEPELIAERLRLHEQEAIDHLKTHEKDNNLFDQNYFSAEQWQEMISGLQQIVYQSKQIEGFESVKLKLSSQRLFDGKIKSFLSVLKDNQLTGIKTIVLCDNQGLKDRFIEILDEYEIPLPEIHVGALHHDISLHADQIELINEHQIFKRFKRRKAYKKFKRAEALRALNTLSYGDFVVHVDFGIGRFVGLHVINVNQAEKECLKIEYQDKDYVYVGIDRIQRIQKYVSEDGVVPKLTKLGGKEWDKLRTRTKKQVETIARELVELYAERSMSQGHAFSPDNNWQHELEASFEFEDTADQKTATEDLKKDMELPKPMDRLVCGDVGFGKTEIAIRAAFKAAVDSKQVAILVPTTILAQQHFETFSQRLANFPVRIDLLSRFRTTSQQKKTVEKLKAGEIDIIVGTHRLLSEDIAFKDLGLIIVDEEQRFGVKNKEKLKELKRGVDVLTLTATPIPRTLHQSLVGIRGISNIETAPVNRLPILTEIIDWDEDKIYTAIIREMDRGGQVFFVHNRVQTIEEIYSLINNIVPKARIAIGHGQMKERELEQVMIDFKNHKYDILLATMIIENGLDIPNANTILINHAERFGLAQLYQLRGRVGRSDHQAYAYLIAPKNAYYDRHCIETIACDRRIFRTGIGNQNIDAGPGNSWRR